MSQLELFDAIHKNTVITWECEAVLRELAHGASLMGQKDLASKLSLVASRIVESAKVMNEAQGKAIHENMMNSEKTTNLIITATIAGITLGKRQ